MHLGVAIRSFPDAHPDNLDREQRLRDSQKLGRNVLGRRVRLHEVHAPIILAA